MGIGNPKSPGCNSEHGYAPDKERAKRILIEILRTADGHVGSTTELYKAFYFAHLWYSANCSGYLSDWPIVRMPRGPGIGRANELIDDLVRDRVIEVARRREGPFNSNHYRLLTDNAPGSGLQLDEIEAIRAAVRWMQSTDPARMIEITHAHSRSWILAQEGDELNIYVDLLDESEFERLNAEYDNIAPLVDQIVSAQPR